jgi:hypothetical protein
MRINVHRYDDEGTKTLDGWFDRDKAEEISEATDWNGSNHFSVHTRTQFHHEMLLRTHGGRWVLHEWSQWQNDTPTYSFVDDAAAKKWLIVNGSDDVVERYFGQLEDERGPGRPAIGDPINVRLGDLQDEVDALASARGQSRADTVRQLVARGLEHETP